MAGVRSYLWEDVKRDVCAGCSNGMCLWNLRDRSGTRRNWRSHLQFGQERVAGPPCRKIHQSLTVTKTRCKLFKRQTKEQQLPRMYQLLDCVKLCSYMIKSLFSQTTIHLQIQMYGFAFTPADTCVMGLLEHVARWSRTSVSAIVLVTGSLVELHWLQGGGGGVSGDFQPVSKSSSDRRSLPASPPALCLKFKPKKWNDNAEIECIGIKAHNCLI